MLESGVRGFMDGFCDWLSGSRPIGFDIREQGARSKVQSREAS